jgi:hypothetical protein
MGCCFSSAAEPDPPGLEPGDGRLSEDQDPELATRIHRAGQEPGNPKKEAKLKLFGGRTSDGRPTRARSLGQVLFGTGVELVKSKGPKSTIGKIKAGVAAGVDLEDDDMTEAMTTPNAAALEAALADEREAEARMVSPEARKAAEAAAAEAAAAEAAAAEAAAEAAAAEAAAAGSAAVAEAEAKARAEAEAQEARVSAAKLNADLAARVATNAAKPKPAAPPAVDLDDETRAFETFLGYEGEVQRTVRALLERGPAASPKGWRERQRGRDLFTLLGMEEATRNTAFLVALQTKPLLRPAQGRALKSYVILCDAMLNKLMPRIPSMARGVAPFVSAYLSTVSQHRDLAKMAFPDGISRGF